MKYAGMPMGMWVLFAGSFQKQLTAVLGYDAATARAITKKAKLQYRQIIAGLPEFEKADRFKMNLVNCAMVGAFILSMPQRPEVDRLTDYYARSMMTAPMLPAILPLYLPMLLLFGIHFVMLLIGKMRYPRWMLAFHPVTWNLLLAAVPDIAQAMQVPVATWMSVMSQSSTNSAILIWCIAVAVYEKKHSAHLAG